ncbi:hypothetical protein [Brucepastera parasyntrophica]|uniref:hypothetical protein n=1 Tax=Brucepastera parasyntrophica TaxID=2880008 RepID=UPI00210D4789|nr:hypothetical protein [Brucepastera parasyntrophica]
MSLIDSCKEVTILGGKYPLDNYALSSLDARAISNEFTGVPVTVSLTSGVLLIVVTPKQTNP